MAAEYWSVNGGVAVQFADAERNDAPPLVVDLDGAVLKVDILHEGLIALLLKRPWQAFRALMALLTRGRAAMRAMIASSDVLDVEVLPMREDLLAWLREQVAAGRALHLVSAADEETVTRLAGRLHFFATWIGPEEHQDLRGAAKATWLKGRFPRGFSYVGSSTSEPAVWQAASSVVVAGAPPAAMRDPARLNKSIEAQFPVSNVGTAAFLQQLRLHQWSKNVLVFLPLLLAHRFADLQGWVHVLLAFAGMGLTASATYVVNDLSDLSDDRRHVTKRHRPLAAGSLSSLGVLATVPLMLIAGFGLTFAANSAAAIVLASYLALTLAYSFRLKRVALLDTAVIGLLFTLRIVLGAEAVGAPPSPWLLAFSVMLFFSLAMAKRQSEFAKALRANDTARIAKRGYEPGDVVLTLVYGIASGVASLVISMLYITNGVATALYANPNWLWAVPLLLYLWQMRVWLLAHRGVLDDDPIVFALKDRTSLALGAGCLLALYLAL